MLSHGLALQKDSAHPLVCSSAMPSGVGETHEERDLLCTISIRAQGANASGLTSSPPASGLPVSTVATLPLPPAAHSARYE